MFGKKEPPASEEHFRKWTQIRRRGAPYYVLTRGILLPIICEAVGFLIFEVWPGHKPLGSFRLLTLNGAVGLIVLGSISGLVEWGSNERRYQREMMRFSSSNYETPEQTLKQLQRGIEHGR